MSIPQIIDSPAQKRLRLPFLDGIRGLAALYVVLYHITGLTHCDKKFNIFNYGHLAVTIFIVLSGFSLMLPVLNSPDGSIKNFPEYIKRRARRILPPYYAALTLSVAAAMRWPIFRNVNPAQSKFNTLPIHLFPSIVAHVLMIQNFSPHWIFSFDGPMWSVSTEWDIYFLFPLLLLPLRKKIGPFAAIFAGFTVGLLSLVPQFAPACFWYAGSFAIGMLGAEIAFGKKTNSWKSGIWLAVATICIGIAWTLARHQDYARLLILTAEMFLGDIFAAIAAASLLIALSKMAQTEASNPLLKLLTLKPIEQLGLMSYSLYLLHHPIVTALANETDRLGYTPLRQFGTLMLALPLILAFAYAFHLAFEKPFMRFPKPAQDTDPQKLPLAEIPTAAANLS